MKVAVAHRLCFVLCQTITILKTTIQPQTACLAPRRVCPYKVDVAVCTSGVIMCRRDCRCITTRRSAVVAVRFCNVSRDVGLDGVIVVRLRRRAAAAAALLRLSAWF